MKTTIKDLAKYRSVWMGIAMCLVMLTHIPCSFEGVPLIEFLIKIGYMGVDIFFFAAGFGGFCSYERDHSVKAYYIRRFTRVFSIYYAFIPIYLIYHFIFDKIQPIVALRMLFGVQFILGDGGKINWFIPAILFFYILTPFLSELIENKELKQCAIIVIIVFLFSSLYLGDSASLNYLMRFIMYLLGMICAKFINYVVTKKFIIVGSLLFCIGMTFEYIIVTILWDNIGVLTANGVTLLPALISTIPFCFLVSFLCRIISRNVVGRLINNVFTYIGNHSFELLLLHALFLAVPQMLASKIPFVMNHFRISVLLFYVVDILLAHPLKMLSSVYRKLMEKCFMRTPQSEKN